MGDGGFLDGFPVPETVAGGLVIVAFLAVLVGLWLLIRRSRERHYQEMLRRKSTEPPPEPDDPTKLPGE